MKLDEKLIKEASEAIDMITDPIAKIDAIAKILPFISKDVEIEDVKEEVKEDKKAEAVEEKPARKPRAKKEAKTEELEVKAAVEEVIAEEEKQEETVKASIHEEVKEEDIREKVIKKFGSEYYLDAFKKGDVSVALNDIKPSEVYTKFQTLFLGRYGDLTPKDAQIRFQQYLKQATTDPNQKNLTLQEYVERLVKPMELIYNVLKHSRLEIENAVDEILDHPTYKGKGFDAINVNNVYIVDAYLKKQDAQKVA